MSAANAPGLLATVRQAQAAMTEPDLQALVAQAGEVLGRWGR